MRDAPSSGPHGVGIVNSACRGWLRIGLFDESMLCWTSTRSPSVRTEISHDFSLGNTRLRRSLSGKDPNGRWQS